MNRHLLFFDGEDVEMGAGWSDGNEVGTEGLFRRAA
jgi:hypothetical protein